MSERGRNPVGRAILWVWIAIIGVCAVVMGLLFISDPNSFTTPPKGNQYCDASGNCDDSLSREDFYNADGSSTLSNSGGTGTYIPKNNVTAPPDWKTLAAVSCEGWGWKSIPNSDNCLNDSGEIIVRHDVQALRDWNAQHGK